MNLSSRLEILLFNLCTSFCRRSRVQFNPPLHHNTIKSLSSFRTLRAPCNILIGSCALFDVVHQLGTFTQSPQIYLGQTMTSWTCSLIMFLPEMGVAAGSFAVLSIGIDRFLSVATPNYYRRMNVPVYLSIHFLAITAFCAYNTFLIVYFYRDHDVICNIPSVFHDNAVSLWAYSSAAVNFVAFVAYAITWRLIKAQSVSLEVDKMNRIFRTIVLVTIFDLNGWAVTQTLVATQNFFDLADHKRLCYVCFASIFVNLGIAVKFLVYYFTSTEYKNAVKRRFNLKDYKIAQSGKYNQSISKI